MENRVGKIVGMIVVSILTSTIYAGTFKINIDLQKDASKEVIKLKVPKGAEKSSERYFRFAEKTHPLVLEHNFAAPLELNKPSDDDDPLESFEADNEMTELIKNRDKNVEYVVRTTRGKKTFVIMIVNRDTKKSYTGHIELKKGKMYEPVYRRVYSEDGGKTWTTAAWQPPRASDLYPWTIDVPANTAQTITIILK